MGDIVDLDLRNRQPTSHEDEFNRELVQDLARYSEGGGLITEKEIRRRYRFDDAVWESLADNEALISAVEDEKTRRIRSGQLKRELSQRLVTQAPEVLGSILCDPNANPRHRIDSAKTLDDFSANSPSAAPSADRFIIQINLGDETLKFNKSIKPDPFDVDPYNDVDTDVTSTPWGLVAAISTKKDDGGGQGHI